MANQFISSCLCALAVLVTLKYSHVTAIRCGETDFVRSLIINGTRTKRGEWPFLVALSLIENSEFFCGGTLISEKHVLTAAHCINHKSSSVRRLPVDVVVHLGAYNLKMANESNAMKRYVSEIYVHPDWKQDSKEYDADIAILSLNETVTYTNYIRPMCMPAGNATTVDDIEGSVVGWGSTGNGTGSNLEFIKHSAITTLNGSYCYTIDYNVARSSSVRTFCGRGEDGSPYKGDSGGGFYVRFASTWVQYGIVSNLNQDARGFVDEHSVAVYTNVKHFKNWIMETVNQSGSTVGEAEMIAENEIHLRCHYSLFAFDFMLRHYVCAVYDLNIRSDNIAVTAFGGSMTQRRTAEDVEEINLQNGTMFFLPTGIGKIFKNLKEMNIYHELSLKSISRSNLKNLETLKHLWIGGNGLETLNEDTLWDLPNLERFSITNNNLKEISGSIFERNTKLKTIDLKFNKLEMLPGNLFQNNSLLEYVRVDDNRLNSIDEKMFETNTKLKDVRLSSNKLKNLPKNLFKNNLLLELVDLQQNSLKTIDEKIFQANANLKMVALPENQLQILPKNLFQNNLLLEYIEVWDNHLKIVEVDFTPLTKLKIIGFYNNVCIDAFYDPLDHNQHLYRNQILNLAEFQDLIRVNCSSEVINSIEK